MNTNAKFQLRHSLSALLAQHYADLHIVEAKLDRVNQARLLADRVLPLELRLKVLAL